MKTMKTREEYRKLVDETFTEIEQAQCIAGQMEPELEERRDAFLDGLWEKDQGGKGPDRIAWRQFHCRPEIFAMVVDIKQPLASYILHRVTQIAGSEITPDLADDYHDQMDYDPEILSDIQGSIEGLRNAYRVAFHNARFKTADFIWEQLDIIAREVHNAEWEIDNLDAR
jgi:hypothetical protein